MIHLPPSAERFCTFAYAASTPARPRFSSIEVSVQSLGKTLSKYALSSIGPNVQPDVPRLKDAFIAFAAASAARKSSTTEVTAEELMQPTCGSVEARAFQISCVHSQKRSEGMARCTRSKEAWYMSCNQRNGRLLYTSPSVATGTVKPEAAACCSSRAEEVAKTSPSKLVRTGTTRHTTGITRSTLPAPHGWLVLPAHLTASSDTTAI